MSVIVVFLRPLGLRLGHVTGPFSRTKGPRKSETKASVQKSEEEVPTSAREALRMSETPPGGCLSRPDR